jgi:hypothetical protein
MKTKSTILIGMLLSVCISQTSYAQSDIAAIGVPGHTRVNDSTFTILTTFFRAADVALLNYNSNQPKPPIVERLYFNFYNTLN